MTLNLIIKSAGCLCPLQETQNVSSRVCRDNKLWSRKCDEKTSLTELGQLPLHRHELNIVFLNFTLQPRALFPLIILTVRQPKSFPPSPLSVSETFIRADSILWCSDTFNSPDLKQQFIRFHQQPHAYTPLYSASNFSCQSLSEIIIF